MKPFLALGLLLLTLSCSHSTRRSEAESPRATWMNKTGLWIDEMKRLKMYKVSQRLDRMKEITERFNIDTVYVNGGSSALAYNGYHAVGLFNLCRYLKDNDFHPWISFPKKDWHLTAEGAAQMQQLVSRFARDNAREGQCFAGIHWDFESPLDPPSETRIVMLIGNANVPQSLRAPAKLLQQLTPHLTEAVVLGTSPYFLASRRPAGKGSKTTMETVRVRTRPLVNTNDSSYRPLTLAALEGKVSSLETRLQSSAGSALLSLEVLLSKFDKEKPPIAFAP